MDDDYIETQRDLSKRKKRWSMNSQRLEEIVAELMKPISDVRRSFDTDLSALLEEYLTEAGLHALEASDDEEVTETAPPNFAELALLLQQSASIYSRKVDFLYQHVLSVSDSLQNSTIEAANAGADEPQTPTSGRRKRKASAAGVAEFALVELSGGAGGRREGSARPPPTLPRMFVELEPRQLCAADRPLVDYDGEPVGLLADFHCCWRLQDGLLVEELATGKAASSGARPLALSELSAALTARASPGPPPSPPTPPPPSATPPPASPPPSSPPPSPLPSPLPCSTPLPTQVEKKERKRKNEVKMEDVSCGSIKLHINKEGRARLRIAREFGVPARWRRRVLLARRARLLDTRSQLRADPPLTDFRGFDTGLPVDVGGFLGWSGEECASALAALAEAARTFDDRAVDACDRAVDATATRVRADDSDDDGFFEQSSLGDSDGSRADDSLQTLALTPVSGDGADLAGGGAWGEWSGRVLRDAAAAERRGGDVQAAAAVVLRALPPAPPARPFSRLLADVVQEPHDVAKYFLATLFLANAGNVEVVPGAPLTLNTFSVRLVSTDERLYRTAAAAGAR